MRKNASRGLGILVLSSIAVADHERLMVGDLSSADLRGWKAQLFEGETDYTFINVDGHTARGRWTQVHQGSCCAERSS
jgi:hypothetical protein